MWSFVPFVVFVALVSGFSNLIQNEKRTDWTIFRIGYVYQDTITALRGQKLLENKLKQDGISIEWIEFRDEVALYQALKQGNLDFGKVGDAVPAFLHTDINMPMYLAAEPPNPGKRAIAISKGSSIQGVEDLKGKKVAYTRFSNDHYFLLRWLDQSGLGVEAIGDFESIEASPSEGVELLKNREIDALVISEPYVSHLESLQYSLLFKQELPANLDVYVSTEENVKDNKQTLDTVLSVLYEYDEFLTNDIHLAAESLKQNTNFTHAEWLAVFEREKYGMSNFFTGMIAEQQEKVDFLYEHKMITKRFEVADYVVQ